MYKDNERKYVVVVYSRCDAGIIMNAALHSMIGLCEMQHAKDILHYSSEEFEFSSYVSRWPVIILKTDRQSLLRRFHASAVRCRRPVNAFVKQMVGASAQEQIKNVRGVTQDSVEYIAISAFCEGDELSDITRKLSLYR